MGEPKIVEANWKKEFEGPILEEWKKKRVFAFRKSSKKVFSIDTPPPYVNSPIHMGHATTYVLMDMFARYHRMIGDSVIFPLGLDRNGLPIEIAAEKKFNKKFNEVSREEFLEMCRKVLEEFSLKSKDSFFQLGISFNSYEMDEGIGSLYLTDSDEYRALTQDTFVDLWNKGLVYEAARTNNYCPGCKTTIADSEIVYAEKNTLFSDVKWRVKETGEEVVIGTTRPEFLCSCEMVIFHPDDKRYVHLEGKHAVVPLYGREVPIKAHPQAQMDKGTGLVMMCAFGDYADVRFFREQGLTPRIAIDIDGKMNKNAGFLYGLYVKQARAKVLEELKSKGLIVKQEQVVHRTPVCERSKDPIEFIEMKEWYLKQVEFKEDLKKIAGELRVFDERSRTILMDWIESVSIDWPLSRRRYYATEVPVWYCEKCSIAHVPKKKAKQVYYRPWKEPFPDGACASCGGKQFKGDVRVFDTWFDSATTPLYVLRYGKDKDFFEKNMPCSLRPQGKEIVRTWLYYTLLKTFLLTGKPAFADVWIHHHITDESGTKLSKSLGNVIDPQEILKLHGAEPFRLWAAVEGDLTMGDLRCSFDRIEGAKKTLTKLWNVARFVSMFEQKKVRKRQPIDLWILGEVNLLIKQAGECYAKYDFHTPAVALRHFLWETFASHYLELVKNRAYNDGKFSIEEQASALATLHDCLRTILALFYPVIPLITTRLLKDLYEEDSTKLSMPEEFVVESVSVAKEDLVELNSLIWKTKKDKGFSLKSPIKRLVVPKKFESMAKDLVSAHAVEKLEFGEKVEIEV